MGLHREKSRNLYGPDKRAMFQGEDIWVMTGKIGNAINQQRGEPGLNMCTCKSGKPGL